MKKITQVGLAVALYTENKDIAHEEFVSRMLAEFPALPARTAALYWQNKDRRASFGLGPVRLPDAYKDPKTAREPKPITLAEPKQTAEKPKKAKAEPKSAEEVERIKEANLARLKAVHAKRKQNVKREEPTEIEADPFGVPETLSVEEVTALV